MGQRGFWDEQQRVDKLKTKKPFLELLYESIPWESFRTVRKRLSARAQKQCWSAENRFADPLQNADASTAFQSERRRSLPLAVDKTEFQVNDRLSFEVFVGFGVLKHIPDSTTLVFFRKRLRKAGVINELFRDS